MKSYHSYKNLLLVFAVAFVFSSCEDVINPELEKAQPILVIDAWLNNLPGAQQIKLMRTQPYFENVLPPGVSGAVVTVEDEKGKLYSFIESESGVYVWTPVGDEVFGEVGLNYKLTVKDGPDTFVSESRMGRTPVIDSLTFYLEPGGQFLDDLYLAEFWSTDLSEIGNAYWIKTFKNGNQLLKPNEIVTAYDAGFSKGGSFNGVTFIAPIRRAINPFDEAEDGTFESPYAVGDSVYVEIHSVTEAAFNFLNEVRIQTDRPGGFSELFATPLANVSTNIKNTAANGAKVVGFFNVGAVTGSGRKFKSLDDLSAN
jgi:hypothetical protein